MNKFSKIIGFGIFFLTLIFANFTSAQTLKNAGFTGREIIVSNNVPLVGEMVRMSMPIYNESGGVLTGVVRLYKNDKILGEKAVTLKVGEFGGFSNEWKAEPGVHEFTLKLEDTFIQKPKMTKELVVLDKREAVLVVRTQGLNDQNSESLLKEYPIESEDQVIDGDTGIDAYRKDFLHSTEEKINYLKQDIAESIKQNEEYEKRLNNLKESLPRSDGSLLTPVQYLYAWGLGALTFILSNAYAFYGTIILIIFLLLRYIVRKIGRRHRNHRL